MRRVRHLVVAATIGFVCVLAALLYLQRAARPEMPPDDLQLLWPEPKRIRAFELSAGKGTSFKQAHLEGRWTFWFFGYTHCPDVCPLTLSVMNEVHARLASSGDLGEDTQFVFVSVDPARDDLVRVSEYVGFFNADFIGATGTYQDIESVSRQFGIFYLLREPDAAGNYFVDHSAAMLLTDPSARFVASFGAPHDADSIVRRFRRIAAFIDG